jgi:RHS repeat-associated protein
VEASYKTIRYSGQERDATGLYYYGMRYYMPWRQRWLSADPMGAAEGLNLYRMVHGNPIRLVDVQGLAGEDASLTGQGDASGHTNSVSVWQWSKASVASAIRGAAAGGIGASGKLLTKVVLELAAGPSIRVTNAVVSAAAQGYAAGGWAENIIRVNRIENPYTANAIRVAGYAGGAGMGGPWVTSARIHRVTWRKLEKVSLDRPHLEPFPVLGHPLVTMRGQVLAPCCLMPV